MHLLGHALVKLLNRILLKCTLFRYYDNGIYQIFTPSFDLRCKKLYIIMHNYHLKICKHHVRTYYIVVAIAGSAIVVAKALQL